MRTGWFLNRDKFSLDIFWLGDESLSLCFARYYSASIDLERQRRRLESRFLHKDFGPLIMYVSR
jgi:hypothetical protein